MLLLFQSDHSSFTLSFFYSCFILGGWDNQKLRNDKSRSGKVVRKILLIFASLTFSKQEFPYIYIIIPMSKNSLSVNVSRENK